MMSIFLGGTLAVDFSEEEVDFVGLDEDVDFFFEELLAASAMGGRIRMAAASAIARCLDKQVRNMKLVGYRAAEGRGGWTRSKVFVAVVH